MDEATARTDIRVQEAGKAHNIRTFSQGRGAKKKGPNCIQIRVLLCKITLILIQMHPEVMVGCILALGGVHFQGWGALLVFITHCFKSCDNIL